MTPEPSIATETKIEPEPIEPELIEPMVGRTNADLPSDADLARAVRARPQLIPAALALAAVARFGDAAREQALALRRTYPQVAAERLARVVTITASRRARYALPAILLGGPFGIAADVAMTAWARTRVVLDVAAILGHDPSDPARAADVLMLLGIYPNAQVAAEMIAELAGEIDSKTHPEATREPLYVTAGTRLVLRAASRVLPGTATAMRAVSRPNGTTDLVGRAIRFYRR